MASDFDTPPPDSQKVAERWSAQAADRSDYSSAVYWLAIPQVMARHQAKGTGGRPYKDWVECCLGEFLPNRLPVERMLSLGCGRGTLERQLAELQAFKQCDAYDIAPGAIKVARAEAKQAGLNNIRYEIQDINVAQLPSNYYDAVWFNGSLHHIEALEKTCEQIISTLKPGGYLFFNEYVGPSRFDFTQRQKEVLRAAFALIPQRFRRSFVPHSPEFQQVAPIPDPQDVQAADPSEAVRSAEIMPIIRHYFDVVMYNEMGGTILQFLLSGIAGNFSSDDSEALAILNMLITIEDALITAKDIGSDFVVVAAQPKKVPQQSLVVNAVISETSVPSAEEDSASKTEAIIAERDRLARRLQQIESTKAWRFVESYWKTRDSIKSSLERFFQ